MNSIILDCKMRDIAVRNIAINLKRQNYSYFKIGSMLGISKDSARNLCVYRTNNNPKKRGPKFKIMPKENLRLKRTISNLMVAGQKINCTKLMDNCELSISKRTLQRHMMKSDMIYMKIKSQIVLSKKHKEERVNIISRWITSNHKWEKTIFSDEKRFSLDGPDDWRTYISKSETFVRQKRQCGGSGIMVWLMAMPNGILSYRVIEGKFGSNDYIRLLQDTIVPIIKLNFGFDFYYQEDNSPVHKAKNVKEFMKASNINVLEWPAKSPDLNIVEDIWKTLSDMVYDGPQFANKRDLIEKINESIMKFNSEKRQFLINLYEEIRGRLCKVLIKNGNMYNK